MDGCAFSIGLHTLDTGLLTAALCDAGAIGSERVVACTATPLSRQGATSRIYRLRLEYDRAVPEAPRTLLAKLASEDSHTRAVMNALGAYERELRFYGELAPTAGVRTPRCYYAAQVPEEGTFLLLLEDLGSEVGIDSLATLELALCELARLHAAHFGCQRLGRLAWVDRSEVELKLAAELLGGARQRVAARFGGALPHTFTRVLELACTKLECLRARERRRACTVVHGDLHPRIVRRDAQRGWREAPGSPGTGVAFIDWQAVDIGSPGRDLARLIALSMPPMPRLSHERRLVALYHGALREQGVLGYSLRDCFQDYRFGLVGSTLLNAFALAELDPAALAAAQEDGPTPMEFLAHRLDAALESNALLPLLHAELFLARAA